ncbi:MAG: S41 family peptidase [Rikenellaceae bacterium]|nr:S41 family peptidase [Rikenellaceae bacterium]MCL2692882.1 S41 family peptidase [Rikenellaceae bacterium]
MKFLKILAVSFIFSAQLLSAADSPLWLRYPAISPDAGHVAFAYKGDIYTVATTGGAARQITTHVAHSYMPVWSPDSRSIAFASNRHGNFDVYITSATGGAPRRLTTFSGGESPYAFTPDGRYVVFGANIQAPAASVAFPSGVMSELYKVSVDGGRVEQIIAAPAENVNFFKDGRRFVYHDKKGQENQWRKHHTSSVTRDIWMYDTASGEFTQLVAEAFENQNPVISPDGKTVYYLSGRAGALNVHSFPLSDPSRITQVTNFATHPVRFLSIADDGTLCFGYDGEIYTMRPGGEPQKLTIRITEDGRRNNIETISNQSVSARAISQDGKQVASTMRGDIFVSSTEYRFTRPVTHTATQNSSPSFSADGRTLVYASQKSGTWTLYTASIVRPEEQYFFNATLIDDKPLFPPSAVERMHPQYSPDGKEIAFIEDRNRLMVYNIASGAVRQITDGTGNPNSSGHVEYEWSPDGKWFALLYTPNKRDPYSDVGLVSAAGGGEVHNLTGSGYTSANPRWVLGGDAILFRSERYGMRSHASWGTLTDAMIVFLNQAAYDKFRLSDDEYKLLNEGSSGRNSGRERNSNDNNIAVELRGIEDRILRLTPNSSALGDALLSPEGDRLYYIATFEKDPDLWSIHTRTRETKLEVKNAGSGSLTLSPDGKTLYLMGRNPQKITLAGGRKEAINVSAQMELDLAAEREYMFNNVWTQQAKRFYVTDMHGVDWDAMYDDYKKFLPHIDNNHDFAEMLSEMLGELNVSHTGARYTHRAQNSDATASLGLLFSWTHRGDGLLVDEVVEKGPFDTAESRAAAGVIVEAINGEKILVATDHFALLNKQAGRNTLVSFYNPATRERWDEVVRPIAHSALNDLLYRRWVRAREADVEHLSGGRLGYVHIQGMADASFRSIYSDILGRFNNKEAIVVDIRFNGGGRMHEDLEILFSGDKYFTQVIRGVESCDMPSRRWNKPTIMLMGEASYSNAHGTPWVYRHTDIGKLVGMPVPGTMTSVSWETLQDPSLVFGIPIVGYQLPDGSYLENQQLEPDFRIANSPARMITGQDEQLEKAVEELLRQLDGR